MATFKAIVIEKTESGQSAGLKDFDAKDLMEGDVSIAVEWSTVNYKDGLAITGRAPVVRRFPMIAGVDASNTASIRMHERLGFERVAHFREVGWKFGRWLDLVFLQRHVAP